MRFPILLILLMLPAGLRAQTQLAPSPATTVQQPVTPDCRRTGPGSGARPRIGVALEGGGALGLAHIGVLQWFEDHHIPIDYLAGTSMGGLVGGLYATGKSPQ